MQQCSCCEGERCRSSATGRGGPVQPRIRGQESFHFLIVYSSQLRTFRSTGCSTDEINLEFPCRIADRYRQPSVADTHATMPQHQLLSALFQKIQACNVANLHPVLTCPLCAHDDSTRAVDRCRRQHNTVRKTRTYRQLRTTRNDQSRDRRDDSRAFSAPRGRSHEPGSNGCHDLNCRDVSSCLMREIYRATGPLASNFRTVFLCKKPSKNAGFSLIEDLDKRLLAAAYWSHSAQTWNEAADASPARHLPVAGVCATIDAEGLAGYESGRFQV